MNGLKRLLLNSLLLGFFCAAARADQMSGGDYVIIKDLVGASGTALITSPDYSLGFAWGEPAAGDVISQSTYSILSGYFGGGFGNGLAFTVISTQIGVPGNPQLFQNQIQVGLPYDAPVQVVFSDELNPSTIPSGIQAVMITDHLGLSANADIPITTTFDPTARSVTIRPQGTWTGNSLYDIQLTPQLLNVDGFPLNQTYHIYFLTRLDPHQENVVLVPQVSGSGTPSGSASADAMSIQIQTESLSDYATVLISQDALSAPLHVNPQMILQANAKAEASGGPYRTPLSVQEMIAYDTKGNLMQTLSTPAQLSIHYNGASSPALVRPQTLALWVLDTAHQLWVKIPASQNVSQTVLAPVTQFSVYALMGSPDGSASDSFAFPVPWRPHGPNAGTGPGQTGTEADGITFSNLPSECSIKIYSIAGDLVREMHHSDTGGFLAQEKWDVKTTHGDSVASGVFLWRVESSVDGKNGKLMIIR